MWCALTMKKVWFVVNIKEYSSLVLCYLLPRFLLLNVACSFEAIFLSTFEGRCGP